MPSMQINLDGDGVWPDLHEKEVINTLVVAVAALGGGMTSGRPSVSFRIDLPDGRVVIAETSMRIFVNAANAFRIRYEKELGDMYEERN